MHALVCSNHLVIYNDHQEISHACKSNKLVDVLATIKNQALCSCKLIIKTVNLLPLNVL